MEFNGTFLVAFISFIVFTIIMNLILYKPISDIVAKRKKYIDSNYGEAQDNSDKSQAIYADRENQLSKAKNTAIENVTKKTKAANAQKDEQTAVAKNEAQKFIDDTRVYYLNATRDAKNYLRTEIVTLAQAISNKFLSAEEHIENVDEDIINNILQG